MTQEDQMSMFDNEEEINQDRVDKAESKRQKTFFDEMIDLPTTWEELWQGMPEFAQPNSRPEYSITVHFENQNDLKEFEALVKQTVTTKTKSIWYPRQETKKPSDYEYVCTLDEFRNPKYPIYIPSKGRYESRLTARALKRMNVPYRIVVEPSEFVNYVKYIDYKNILILPKNDMKLIGSRCWIMEHAISEGHKKHWQLDDNISGFIRFNRNIKIPVMDGSFFRVIEEFSDRFENVAYSGPNYRFFAEQRGSQPPFRLNTRIYSCTLVNNQIPYRWRSIYNDDTDVSLMALKDGWCTILFQAFLCNKAATMTVKGGNTEQLYTIEDGRLKMAQALQELHPDVVTITKKWGRWQHHVNYELFKKNKLVMRKDLEINEGVNNYGMMLQRLNNKRKGGETNDNPKEE